jgi:CRP/FNR family transcriptional regulator, cyclic AMP receptor protein
MSEAAAANIETLRAVPMFAALDDVALKHVTELATPVDLPAGYVLLNAGQEGSGMFVVLDGTVRVELAGGTEIDCSKGEFIGELSLLVDGLLHTCRARAATPVQCLAISRDDFARLLETYPQIAIAMLHVLARRLADTDALFQSR